MKKCEREDLKLFADESSQRFLRIAADLQKLGKGGLPDQKLIAQLFRETHSLKAAANLLGLKPVELIAHKLEDMLDIMRSGNNPLPAGLAEILHSGFSRIKQLIEHPHLMTMVDINKDIAILETRLLALNGKDFNSTAKPV